MATIEFWDTTPTGPKHPKWRWRCRTSYYVDGATERSILNTILTLEDDPKSGKHDDRRRHGSRPAGIYSERVVVTRSGVVAH